jgi:hypothetical protein
MPAHHVHELRVTLRGPDRSAMADGPERNASDPKMQAEADGGG